MQVKPEYDIVVTGGGIAGSITALCLSRAGIRTLVVEVARHPRFAIGESTIPTTTQTINYLAAKYRIPELRGLTHYSKWRKTPSCSDYSKAHFWFGLHEAGRELETSHELLLQTMEAPVGPDVHLLRADVDEYLVSLLPKYGVDYTDRTLVEDVDFSDDSRARLTLKQRDDGDTTDVTCRFVVDATGHRCFFAERLGYLESEPLSVKTNTRSIYGHFKRNGMRDLDDVLGGPCPLFRWRRESGTMHHCFEGGWIWVIPFDSGTVSIGIVLDRNLYPPRTDMTAEAEFNAILDKFPTVKAHFNDLEPIRGFARKPRLQIMSTQTVGERIIMTPHASAFIDPLFSSGILLTTLFIRDFVPLAKAAFRKGNFDIAQFRPLEANFFRSIRHLDTIVAGMIESFRHIEVFRQYWKIWVVASIYQLLYNIMRDDGVRPEWSGAYGSNRDDFRADVQKMWTIVSTSRDRDQLEVAAELKSVIDRHWLHAKGHPYGQIMGQIGSKWPFRVVANSGGPVMMDILRNHPLPLPWPKALWRLVVFRALVPLKNEVLYFLRVYPKDPRRNQILRDQRLPWYSYIR